jgi:thiol-disulfide isomerase/thioredoxin
MVRPAKQTPFSRRALLIATPIALVAALAVYVALDDGGAGGDDESPQLSLQPAADASGDSSDITLLDGDAETTLAEVLGGKPTVVNFFGSWCAPCVKEMPDFQTVYDDLGSDLSFVGLAVNDRPEDAARIVAQTGVEYPTYRDRDGAALAHFGGGARMPATAFVAADGELIELHNGELTESELRQAIDDAFGAPA